MSPRRSPRLKGLSPKPELPLKPKPPKRVRNIAEDSVRQANYQAELAAWKQAKVEHENQMKIRKAKQRHERERGIVKAPASPAPPPQLAADELRLVGSPALAERGQTADAGTSTAGLRLMATADAGTSTAALRFRLLRVDVVRWLLEIESVAARCGAGAPAVVYTPIEELNEFVYSRLRLQGLWFDPAEYGSMPDPIPHPAQALTDARACAGAQSTGAACTGRIRPSTAASMVGPSSRTMVASRPSRPSSVSSSGGGSRAWETSPPRRSWAACGGPSAAGGPTATG